MKILYVPLIRSTATYTVIFGRRWSVLEHLLLSALAFHRYSAAELAKLTSMPPRLVIEALINLLRASWVEVRSTNSGTYFSATALGKRYATQERLPAEEHRTVRGTALCHDRVSGAWFRVDDLDVVYDRDIPEDAYRMKATYDTFDSNDPAIRNLLRIEIDERIEPSTINFRSSSRPYARVTVAFDRIESGLPASASLTLQARILEDAKTLPDFQELAAISSSAATSGAIIETVSDWNFIIGGPEHFAMLRDALESARDHFIIHSCFLNPDTVEMLLPYFEKAARRGLRIDLLWGLRTDPEHPVMLKPISDSEKILNRLPSTLRPKVQLSPRSSGSHAKVLIYHDRVSGDWITVIGSCNFLSSEFDWLEASFRSRNPVVARDTMSFLLSSQLPSSGQWSAVARRLDTSWSEISKMRDPQGGLHSVKLLIDDDHYACITGARDAAKRRIEIGCDIYGIAAETSVLVPMVSAAAVGVNVSLTYNRPSVRLSEEGLQPNSDDLIQRGIRLKTMSTLHAKYVLWDEEGAALSSFNWLATVVDGSRTRGAELGVMLGGPNLRDYLEGPFSKAGLEIA
jgi:hypothetical protein